jgi:allantoin racemase
VGRRFAVVTTLGRTTARARELVDRYGFRDACVAVRACEVPVLALDGARARLVDECRRAVEQDGADVVVLGCAGMAELCAVIADEIGVPVVDGVAAGTVLAQSLVALGLRPSRVCEYAPPPAKPMAGLLAGFEIRVDAPVAAPLPVA